MTPLVSILLPAYNAERWICDSIETALRQRWPRKEIIVVDDGSTDSTYALAKRYETQGVTVLTQENRGAAAARNTALLHCHGDYIQWLDADDVMTVDKISSQMEVAMQTGDKRTLFTCGWCTFYYRIQAAKSRPSALWRDLSPVEWMIERMESDCFMLTEVWLISRELSEAVGLWDTRLVRDNDGEYFSRVVLAANGVKFVAGPRVYYRQTGSSRVSYLGRSQRKLDSLVLSRELQVKYLLDVENSERTRRACVRYLDNLCFYLHPERPDLIERCQKLATSLGGRLSAPKMPWKYAWLKALLGWRRAKAAQREYNRVKRWLIMTVDKALARITSSERLPFR